MFNNNFVTKERSLIILLNLILLSYFILISFRPIPDSTHYLVSIVDAEKFILADKINEIVFFIKTPIYSIIKYFFVDPKLYFFISALFNFLFINCFYLIFKSFFSNYFLSFFLSCLIIFFKFLLIFSFSINFPLQFIEYFFMRIDLLEGFTVRQLFGLIYFLSIFLCLKKKFFLACCLIFINNLFHPNSNIIAIIIFGLYFLYLFKNKKLDLKILTFFFITNFTYIFYLAFQIFLFSDNNLILEKSIYYSSLIKDEADDFSFLWTLAYRWKLILIIFSIVLSNIFLYKKKHHDKHLIYFSIIPIIFFFLGCIVEYLNLYFNIELINFAIINLQPGWKIIGYTFFPTMLIFGKNIEFYKIFEKKIILNFIILISIFTIFVFSAVGLSRNYVELKNYANYIFKTKIENNYEDWLKSHSIFNDYNFTPMFINKDLSQKKFDNNEKNIFKLIQYFNINDLPQNFTYKFTFDDTYKLIKNIKKKIPKNSGLIIPPYFFNARGIFKDYSIFFAEHPDGNFAMGNFKFFKIINKRMNDLLNFGYLEMPTKQSQLSYSFIRSHYLKINNQKIREIQSKYPTFNYFITEKSHILDFEKVYSDTKFIIYKIN